MKEFKEGDWVYSFMGESLLCVKVCSQDEIRIQVEDGINTYCFYAEDCYPTKEEAIEGMLESLKDITDCDCGQDSGTIERLGIVHSIL